MSLLLKLLYKRKILWLFTICSSSLSIAVTLWWNMQLSSIVDSVSTGHHPSSVMLVLAFVTMFVMSASNYMGSYISGYTCESMTHDLRMGYARHFALIPVVEVEKINAGEQLSKLQNEIASVSGYLSNNLFQLLNDAVRFLTTFLWLMFISPTLTLTANLPAFIIVFYVFWSSKIINTATERSQQAKGQMNKYSDTLLTLFPIIRLYDAARLILGGFMGAIKEWENHTIRSEYTAARLMSLSGVLSSIPLLFLFLVGGRMTINGTLGVGTLYIFLNLSGNVSGALMNMPSHIASFRQFTANMKRLEGNICL